MKLNTKDLLSAGLFIAFAVVGLWLNQDHNLGTARRMGPGYMPMLTFWILIGLGSIVLAGGLFNGPDPLAKWTPGEIGFLIAGAVAGVAAGMIAAGNPDALNACIGVLIGCLLACIKPQFRVTAIPMSVGALVGIVAGMIAGLIPHFASSGWNALGIGLFVGCLVAAIPPGWRALFLPSAAFTLFGLVLEPLGFLVAITLTVICAAFADKEHLERPLGVLGLIAFLCALCWAIFIWYLDIRVPLWPQL